MDQGTERHDGPHFFVAYIATAFAEKQARQEKSDEQQGHAAPGGLGGAIFFLAPLLKTARKLGLS
ncbi:hypothetical protein [Pseudomonas alkylphenolica]|uniref:hypothetical protein n=1 Tax=Pseudomonas alkylphenolica TaxID=237609 RepID=UPI0013E36223|nr:hypothetical protein [Pseudomonas alkylphenolica]